jgi:hypothetical protein
MKLEVNDYKIKKIINEQLNKYKTHKVVTFNGEVDPKYGWAVILMGGVSSGKSTVIREKLPINGKVVNNDIWREAVAKAVNRELKGNSVTNITQTNVFKNIEKENNKIIDKIDLTDPSDLKIVSDLSLENGLDLSKKSKDALLKANKDSKHLPNLIFEMGRNVNSNMKDIIKYLKEFQGYKICVVWLISNRKVAFASMLNRERQLGDKAFHQSHNGMYNEKDGVLGTINNRNINKYIDEAWCIVNTNYDIENGQRVDRYLNDNEKNNVIKLFKDSKGKFNMPLTVKFGPDDEKNIDDIIGLKLVPKFPQKNPAKGIDNQDEQEIDIGHFPTRNQANKWANNHNGQFLKNVKIYKK